MVGGTSRATGAGGREEIKVGGETGPINSPAPRDQGPVWDAIRRSAAYQLAVDDVDTAVAQRRTAEAALSAYLAGNPDRNKLPVIDPATNQTRIDPQTKAPVMADNPNYDKNSATVVKGLQDRIAQANANFSQAESRRVQAAAAVEQAINTGGTRARQAVSSGGLTRWVEFDPASGQMRDVTPKDLIDAQIADKQSELERQRAAAAASRMPNIQQLKIIRTNDKGQKEAVVQFVNADTGEYLRDAKGNPKEISAGDVPLGQRDLIEQVRADTGANGSPPGLYKYTFDLATNEVLKDANGNPVRSYVGPIPQEPTPATFQLAPGRTGYLQKGDDGQWKVVTLNVDPTQEALATKQLAKLQQDIERGTLDLSKLTWQRDKGAWDTELEAQKATLAQAQAATGLTTAQTTGTTLNNAKTAVDVAAKQREAFVDDLVQRGLMTPERGLAYLEGQYTALKAWYDIQKQQEDLRATALKERQSDIDRSITLADRYATWGGYGGTNAQYAANAQGITDKYAKPGEGLGAAILRSTGGGQGLDRNIPAPLTAPQASAYEQAHPNGIFAGNDDFDAFVRRMNASATPGATVTPVAPTNVPGAIASPAVSALPLTGNAPTEASLARDYGASFGGGAPSLAPAAMAWGGPDDEATRDAKLRHLLDLATPSVATPGPMGALGAFGR